MMRRVRLTPGSVPVVYLIALVVIVDVFVVLRWIVELVANSGRGLDASDESYYLLSVEYPHASRSAVTAFDSYLAPIWWLCGGSIARYRVVGVTMLIGTVAATARLCNRRFLGVCGWSTPTVAASCALALAALSLTHYMLWITTPGYNLVVLLVALLVAGMTVSLAMTPVSHPPPESGGRLMFPTELALGFALSVGSVVKPPAFFLIAILSGVALVITRGSKWLARQLWRFAVGFGAGLVLFFVLTGSPWEVARRMTRGVHANGLLGSHTTESLWEITAMRHVYGPWFLRYALGAAALALLWRVIRREITRQVLTSLGSALTAAVFIRTLPGGGAASFGTTGWWWIRFVAMTMLWSTANARVASRKLALGPLIALMAVGAAAGSGNGVIREVALTVGILGVGLLVHGLVLMSLCEDMSENGESRHPVRQAAVLLPIAMFFFVGAFASNRELAGAIRSPYRLNDTLHSESEAIDLGPFGMIKVHPETARYVRELHAIGAHVPGDARDCLVDLAGGTPLAAIALGARPAEVPWILGGYPGSTNFADYVLRDSPCLSGPYLLVEAPLGARAVGRPTWLDMQGATLLGRVQYRGFLTEEQLVWLVPGPPGDRVPAGG